MGALPEGNDFMNIYGGQGSSLALRSDGSLAVWGGDYYGSDYTCAVTCAPKGSGFVDAIAGYVFGGLALRANGSFTAWGVDPVFGTDVTGTTPTGRGFEAIDRSTWAGYAIHSIPEPATYALMLLGLAGVALVAHRRAQH